MRVLIRYIGDPKEVQDRTDKPPIVQVRSYEAVKATKEYFQSIKTLEPVHTPFVKPQGGFTYLFEAASPDKLEGNNL